jgi:uncharacterized protein
VIHVDTVPSVVKLPDGADELFVDVPFFGTREWLHFCEYHAHSEPEHLVATDESGGILGLLPTFAITYEGNPRYRPNEDAAETLPEPLQVESAWFPGVVIGARAGNGNALHLNPALDAAGRAAVLEGLLRAARSRAEASGARALWMSYLTTAQAGEVLSAWPGSDVHLGREVDIVIPLPGPSFDDYLAAMTKKRRANIRRQRRAFQTGDPELDQVAFDEDICGQIAPLLGLMQDKHGMPRTTEWLADRLRHQAGDIGRYASVLLLRRKGRLVAFQVLLRYHSQSMAFSVGVDHDAAGPFDYFNMAFYEPIEVALARGDRSLAMGVTAAEAKMLRGGVPVPLWHVVQPLRDGGLTAERRGTEQRNAERLLALEQWCATYAPGPLDPTSWAMPVRGEP